MRATESPDTAAEAKRIWAVACLSCAEFVGEGSQRVLWDEKRQIWAVFAEWNGRDLNTFGPIPIQPEDNRVVEINPLKGFKNTNM